MADDLLVSMILSFFLPGIGQAYLSGKWPRGVAFFLAACILSIVLIGVLVWIYGLYDTYKMANAKAGKEKYQSPIFG